MRSMVALVGEPPECCGWGPPTFGRYRLPTASHSVCRFLDKRQTALCLRRYGCLVAPGGSIIRGGDDVLCGLVGDSGEQEPEIYGRIARKHSRQIAAILIRNVTDEAADGQRFRRAFEGIERQRWELFRRPEELEGLLGRLSQSQEAAG